MSAFFSQVDDDAKVLRDVRELLYMLVKLKAGSNTRYDRAAEALRPTPLAKETQDG